MTTRLPWILVSFFALVTVAGAGPVALDAMTPVRRVTLRFTLPYDPKLEGFRGMRHQAATSNDVFVHLGPLILHTSAEPRDAFEPELHAEDERPPVEDFDFTVPGLQPLLGDMRFIRRLPDGLRVGDLDRLELVTDDSYKPFFRIEALEILVASEPSGRRVPLFGGPRTLGRRFSEAFGAFLPLVPSPRPDTGTGEPLVLELIVAPGTKPERSTLSRSMAFTGDGAGLGLDDPYMTGLVHVNVGSLDWALGSERLAATIPVGDRRLLRYRLPVPSWFQDADVRLLELARVFHQMTDPFLGDAILAALSPVERREQARWPERIESVRLMRGGRVLRDAQGGLSDRGASALVWRSP